MKQLFILSLAFLAVTGCRKIETDGEKEIFVVTKEVTPVGVVSNIITLTGNITKDTTLLAKDVNYLSGKVYITKGVTLTIEAGAKVIGKTGSNVAALIITRGAKIVAKGTAEKPIVFTSGSANPASGDWGGIVICGTASTNQSLPWKGVTVAGLTQVEGGINDTEVGYGLAGSGDAVFPTKNDADNSGFLQYVRIEYAGYAFLPDNELNSLTMACVGSGTTIDHIQVTYAKDDAYEWFGGTVNCKYLIAYKTQDDDFDTDHGYSGNVQFGIILRDSVIADISQSEAFESDNTGKGDNFLPRTSAVFSNITAIGPKATLSNVGNTLYRAGAHIRRNTGISIMNSIIAGWPIGLNFDVALGNVDKNINDSTIRIKNTTLAGNNSNITLSGTSTVGTTAASLLTWFTTPAFGNVILINATPTDLKLIQPFNYTNPDFTPYANAGPGAVSSATNIDKYGVGNIAATLGSHGLNSNLSFQVNGSFTDAKLQDAFFDKTATFRGAVATSGENQTWWKGWTIWK